MSLPAAFRRPALRIALAYFVLAGLWILASDSVVDLVVGLPPQAGWAQTLKGLAFVSLTSALLYLLLRRHGDGGEPGDQAIATPSARAPLLAFVLFALGLIAIGLFLFHTQREQIRANSETQLRAVGELRIEQILNWLNSAHANARHFGHASQLVTEFEAWHNGGGKDTKLEARMLRRMRLIRESYGHADITLFDRQGTPRLGDKPSQHLMEHSHEALNAMASGRTTLIDFHRHGGSSEPLLGMLAPMIASDDGRERTVGALFFSLPARWTLFPIIQRWPTVSASGETVLVQQGSDGMRIVYASRQPEIAGQGPRIPISQTQLVATRVARGEHGILTNAVDFRLRPVLAYGEAIPGTPWILVAKLDQSEVDTPVNQLARATALVISLLLLAAGLAFWLWWRGQVNHQRAQLLSKELEQQLLARRYDALSQYASDAILLTDDDGIIQEANLRAEQMYGYSRDELLGQPSSKLLPPERREEFLTRRAETLAAGRLQFESEHQRKDGGHFPVEVSAHVIELHGARHGHLTIRDISDQVRAQQALLEREALYRGVIENSVDGFWISDLEGRLLEVNEAYCRRSGYSREELLNMRIRDLDAEEQPEEVARHIANVLRQGSDLFETRHRARDGTIWQVEVNTSYSPTQGGRFFVFLRDIQQRNRSESLLRTRLQLSDLALEGNLDELMKAALDSTELYTGSKIGFFHFVDADQETLTLQAWSSNTLDRMCTVEAQRQARGQHYPVSRAGVWADCIRQRQAMIHNDYASLPEKQGLPEGHAELLRELVVPILRDGKVTAVLGVGNKATDYTRDDVNVVEQIASMVMDVVSRQRAEDELGKTNARLLEAQRSAHLGDWDYDLAGNRLTWSEQVYVLFGLDPALGPPSHADYRRWFHPDDAPRVERDVEQAISEATPFQRELRIVRPNGEVRHAWAIGQALKGADGKVARLFGTIQDISERKLAQAQLEQATHFDPLTGLPNAHTLLDELKRAMTSGDARLALMVLNVDRFAQLNESLGRAAGDQVLVSLAQRWAALLPDSAWLARLDADQFAVFWQEERVHTPEQSDVTLAILEAANSLLAGMARPLGVGAAQQPVSLTLSIGIALYPGDASDPAGLLHAAEDAMRQAKSEKGNKARFFDRQQAQTAIEWFETEAALRQALARDELFLVYQPQVDAANGRVVAAECLIRWRQGDQVIPPGRFIHVVEGTDLAEPVSRWVLHTACRQAKRWLDRNRTVRVAVNIFSDHVTSGHLLDDVRLALAASGLPPALLELEVVESSLLKNPEIAAQTLREIKRMGVGLALDDFGTGYSSLGYLKHYPFDVLKIDQIFARNVTRDPEDAAIVRSTIALAHNLGMRVLAEGVETEPQLRFMARYGCDQIQGYLTCRPTTPEEVETLVMERRDLRPAALAQTAHAANVLIVEDEPVESELLTLLLAEEGYRAHAAIDLEGALDLMGKERIDLILSDHYLERCTGVDVLERLRRLFPDVPRIMVSGADGQEVVTEAVNRGGIRAFLRKPVDADLLLRTVRGLLEESGRG